jgi:hypothetical protein
MTTAGQATRTSTEQLAEELEAQLVRDWGPILSGEALRRALGYRSIESLRQAISRGTIGVPVFAIEHRRGKYALTKDVARWLAEIRQGADGMSTPMGVASGRRQT